MTERHRALPSWMSKKEEKKPLKNQRKRRIARAAFYCMNETELVEAAVSHLAAGACEDLNIRTDQKVEEKAGDAALKIRKKPPSSKTKAKPVADALEEECSDGDDVLETTNVSETDLDITEVETLPYTKSPQHEGPEDQRSGQVQDHSNLMNVEVETVKRQEHSQMKADAAKEEDDALKLSVSAHDAQQQQQQQCSVCPATARFSLTCGLLRSIPPCIAGSKGGFHSGSS
ncbi:hypothetical protein Q8A73_004682 [Channa argus]|nr:hypothetical protein Q8A73_004682 [Channa argus]